MVLIQLNENLSGQCIVLTSDNRLLRGSHGRHRWLDLSQFGILPRNIVDGKYGEWTWGKATEGFGKGVIIMSYHWILTDKKASGAGGNRRKKSMVEVYGMMLPEYISASEGGGGWWGNGPFCFVILNVVQFLIMATSIMWEKMAEMESKKRVRYQR